MLLREQVINQACIGGGDYSSCNQSLKPSSFNGAKLHKQHANDVRRWAEEAHSPPATDAWRLLTRSLKAAVHADGQLYLMAAVGRRDGGSAGLKPDFLSLKVRRWSTGILHTFTPRPHGSRWTQGEFSQQTQNHKPWTNPTKYSSFYSFSVKNAESEIVTLQNLIWPLGKTEGFVAIMRFYWDSFLL